MVLVNTHIYILFFLTLFNLGRSDFKYPNDDVEELLPNVPPYTKYRSGYGGGTKAKSFTKTKSFSGVKTYGTKTAYSGTKTGYGSVKSGSGFDSQPQTYGYGSQSGGYGSQSGGYGSKPVGIVPPGGIYAKGLGGPDSQGLGSYSESKTWMSSSGNVPSLNEFQHNAVQGFTHKCNPDCRNNGICVDTNTCQCPANFRGKFCEFEKKPCLSYPPLPMNSHRKCTADVCTITCMAGHKFIDGSTATNMNCIDGQWRPARADFTTIPDCEPECNPPCLNGGICLSLNTCQCPEDYRGPQCQYSTSFCDFRKLGFNGGYSCFGDGESFSCKVSCPSGAKFDITPAQQYTCFYATGEFLPKPLPQCIYPENSVQFATGGFSKNMSNIFGSFYNYSSSSNSHTGGSIIGQQGVFGSGFDQSGQNQINLGQGQVSLDHEQVSLIPGQPQISDGYSQVSGSYGVGSIVVQDLSPRGGVCMAWAGVHYKTFDGRIYSFQTSCRTILVREVRDHKYSIEVAPGKCKRAAYCPLELTVYLEDKPYTLAVADDGSLEFHNTKRLIPIPASLPGIRVSMPGDQVIVNLDTHGVTLKWDLNTLVTVEGTVQVWNNTQGLCGKFNGDPNDDFTTRTGLVTASVATFAASWQPKEIGEKCERGPSEVGACKSKSDENIRGALKFCTNIFAKNKFRKCSKVMDVTLLLEACQWDYCACTTSLSPEECACNTVSVYAKECLRHGIDEIKSWRGADTCPMRCPEGKVYKSCGPTIQPSCAFPKVATQTENSACVEGCFCPEGLLLEAGRCIPKEECPCRLRNKSFEPGAFIPKDCNTCTCQSGEWKCTQVPCGARCSAVGDPHYTTFDGLTYDFMGHCTYTMVKTDGLTIEVENVACSGAITEAMNLAPYKGDGKPSCTKAVNIKNNGASIHLKQGGFILVNGKEVANLPVHVGKILIRAASSLFIIVQLPNGVDIWWDGSTRVFVDVPAEFHDKTKGLCGTFNLNQKDDFLTPEGDNEQSALAFANKWKTREFCDDISTKEPEHPCKANMENKETAKKYCNKLKSKLFESCHWYVDVEPYYEACLYDMCACEGDVSRCLCPILGDYAMTCAKNGNKIQWRYNVDECALQCDGGQEYTVCADSCQRTCSDVSLSATTHCKPVCVEGCACPAGQVLDNNNQCVPTSLCPCVHKGLEFKPGYKEVRPGIKEQELCTCIGARWECRPATDNDIQNYPPAEDLRSNCSAARHMEFTACEIAEPLTCKNMHLPPSITSAECRPGCQCKKGYVLETVSKKCVLASECPCHHGGRSYPDAHVMQEECNNCTCKSGNWSCTKKPCAGVCTAWGDSHMVTFDGTEYDFEGVCTYLLAKGASDNDDGFIVEIQNVPCGTTGATCSKSVTLKVGSNENLETVTISKDGPLPNPDKLKRIQLRLAGAYVYLDVASLQVSVQWDRGMRVYVNVDSMWQGRVKGLCGNYNGDMRDDFQTPSSGGIAETSALLFADAWKLKPTCPKPHPLKDHCEQRPERKDWATSMCGNLKRYPFSLCHTEVPPTPFIERCEKDACACDAGGDCECACTALAAYAHRCASRGVTFKWRTQELCPMQCNEECFNYDECVTPCPLETCDNTVKYAEMKALCAKDPCVEGCKPKTLCASGLVYSNTTYTECVPRSKCKAVCMTLPDGREILEGEVLEQDMCHSCYCSNKNQVCSGQPCSTEAWTTPTVPVTWTTPATVPHDSPLICKTGWTSWINRHHPDIAPNGDSIDEEPLPKPTNFAIGSPMCERDNMTKIECRTVVNHQSAKATGLNVECSLERGLVCREPSGQCPDFEIKVYCQCDKEIIPAPIISTTPGVTQSAYSTPSPPVSDEFQCLNADHPSVAHPTDCSQFYECTPDLLNNNKPHTVLKSCAPGLMYNSVTMNCDWPAAVIVLRPECGEPTTPTPVTTAVCPPGQEYKKCAYPCNQLCHYFRGKLEAEGKCLPGQDCVDGCVDRSCEVGKLWRDPKSCVPLVDCTCLDDGDLIKPGQLTSHGCKKCQCLENAMHCDTSQCFTPEVIHVMSSSQKLTLTPWLTVSSTPSYGNPSVVHITSSTWRPFVYENMTVSSKPVPTPLIIVTTVTPPPECRPDSYIDLMWGDQPLSDDAFTASSVYNDMSAPSHAILNGQPGQYTGGSWSPSPDDKTPYIEVKLPYKEPIYGLKLQGSPVFDQYVTSYEVLYGDYPNLFTTIRDHDGNTKIFRGPIDNTDVVKQMFEPPIEAKFVRIKPLTWHDQPAMRFELIGCGKPTNVTTAATKIAPLQCTEPLGLAAGLPVESIEVSSNNDDRQLFKLDGERGWTPLFSTPGEWIMFDFMSPRNITGVITKGGKNGWVTAYNILYTSDLSTFNPILDNTGAPKLFPANFDKNTAVTNEFRPPVHARYLKVLPMKWKNNIEMRVEPVGCFEPYPVTEPTTPSQQGRELMHTTKAPCKLCPHVSETIESCPCGPHQYYDGENCVSRDQCPCVQGFMTYVVGSKFQGSNCDECTCKLGGVSDCKPVNECKCTPELVPKLSQMDCKCLCEPCPLGYKICPTSKICLPLEKWCDGLQDCPDDERSCTTTTIEPTVVTKVTYTVGLTRSTIALTKQATPIQCPKVECPPGYQIQYLTRKPSNYFTSSTGDLPPPRPRKTYSNYFGRKGSYTSKGGAKGGFSKGGFSKGGTKGGYGQNQAFTLEKNHVMAPTPAAPVTECQQFKCFKPPPLTLPGSPAAPVECSAPQCPPQYTLKLELTTDEQHCPEYSCIPPPERPAFCEVIGRTFNTFDGGEFKYDICFHMLAREIQRGDWTVLLRKKCGVEGCGNHLYVMQDQELIIVKPSLIIEYNNYEYTVEQTNKICFQKNSFDLSRLGNGLVVKSRRYNVTVFYNKDGDVKIGVAKSYLGDVDGLCGFYDGELSNDRRLPNGNIATSIDSFGTAWAKPGLSPDACKTETCATDKQKRVWETCSAIFKKPLNQCGKVLNLEKWKHICLEKICECTDTVVNGTKRTEDQCKCLLMEQLVSDCLAKDRDIDLGTWRMEMNCPADCLAPLVHHDCYRRRCEPTCSDIGVASAACAIEDGQCFPGCYCPDGKLRKGEDCVAPTDCLDCICTGVGKPSKFVTFENDDLPFAGNCTYLASRDRNDTGLHMYEVYVTNGVCEDNREAVCTTAVHLVYQKVVVQVGKDPKSNKLFTVIGDVGIYKYPVKKHGIVASKVNGKDIVLEIPEVHLQLTILQSKLEFTIRVPSHLYANKTEGLCGVCAGYMPDLMMSDGTPTHNVTEYGNSWKASPTALKLLNEDGKCEELAPIKKCELPPSDLNPCNNIFNAEKFGACHALVDPQSYVTSCEEELCALNLTDVCSLLERYADECRRQGVCVNWRGDLCSLDCQAPLVYRPCVDCERTCENNELFANGKKCEQLPREGCYCPEGKVRVNDTCIEPSKCFPCDANKDHYAGDEWQEDACTKCRCDKLGNENSAHVACTTQSCPLPLCPEGQETVTVPAKTGACCPQVYCKPVPPTRVLCEEPKSMECGFGQVRKLKTLPNGCHEFACECKPANECEKIPSDNEVEIMEPGIERVVDNSGCCPKVELLCRKETCPAPPKCPPFHNRNTENVIGKCCPEYKCELPKDKCVVKLEWEAALKGGEKSRLKPKVDVKDLDSAWLDGPCRSCRCEQSALGPAPQCAVTQCPPIQSTDTFIVEAKPVPFACCQLPVQVACRDGDNIYKVGENWTSPHDPCETYKCVQTADEGKLEKLTTMQSCPDSCEPGWKYFPAEPNSGQCCGKCKPVACIVNGEQHEIGNKWTSDDFCTSFMCTDINGTLQVQSRNESCPEVPESMLKRYVLSEEVVPGQCCKNREPVACRVGDKIYQEGQTWASSDPCKNMTCARDETGRLTHTETLETCTQECKHGHIYMPAPVGRCCGRCVQDMCILEDGELRSPGTKWYSPDNCTTYSCDKLGDSLLVSSSRKVCADVQDCEPEDIVTKDCCLVCTAPKGRDLSSCVPQAIPKEDSVSLIRTTLGGHGLCINDQPLVGFKECVGTCQSGTLYNNQTGSHDSKCECCTAVKYEPITVTLRCADGSEQQHRVASPKECKCQACGSTLSVMPSKGGPSKGGVKSPPRKQRAYDEAEYDIPEIFARFGEDQAASRGLA